MTFFPISVYVVNVNLFYNSKPVCIYPASITLGILAFTHKSHLGSYPFALAQSKEIACILVALAVQTVGKLAFPCLDLHLEIDIEIDGWGVWDGVLLCWLEGGECLFYFYAACICALAVELLQ